MIFDLRAGHLGDVLLAMPAMREGDTVIAHERARVPGLGVQWVTKGEGFRPSAFPAHVTLGWMVATGRDPVRHQLLPEVERDLLVIAPAVQDASRQWRGWGELKALLPEAVWLGDTETREHWMATLNRAHTVVCPDTGTLHMADALGCPKVVGLFGANLDRYAPYWCGPRYCIERAGMAMTAAEVAEVVRG